MDQRIIITNVKTTPYKHVNLNELFDPGVTHKQSFEFDNSVIASPYKGNKLHVTAYSLPPRKSNYPYHYHAGMEEVFYIISGKGLLETPDGEVAVSEGDIIVMPANENGAHKLTNPTDDTPLIYLDIDSAVDYEVVHYPHSDKVRVIMSDRKYYKSFKLDTAVNYLQDE